MTHTHTKSQDQRLIAFKSYSRNSGRTDTTDCYTFPRAALTGKHDTLVRRAHQMLNAALTLPDNVVGKKNETLKWQAVHHRCKNVGVKTLKNF